jgi:hypothetical protein
MTRYNVSSLILIDTCNSLYEITRFNEGYSIENV